MRFIKRYRKPGDVRIIKRFALLPIVAIYDWYSDIRWLETVYIRQGVSEFDNSWYIIDFVERQVYDEYIKRRKAKRNEQH